MKCSNCGAETYKLRMIFPEGKPMVEGCKYCLHMEGLNTRIDSHGCNKFMTPAHYDDIKRRKVDLDTGEVYRDRGRKYFVGG